VNLSKIFELPTRMKFLIVLSWDFLALCFAFVMAYWIRSGIVESNLGRDEFALLAVNLGFTLGILTLLGHYRQIIRFIGLNAGFIILAGTTCSAIYLYLARYPFGAFVPNSVPIIYWALATLLIAGPRMLIYISAQSQGYKMREKCLIYGAEQAGRALALSLKQGNALQPIAFIDDKSVYHGKQILGIPVVGRNKIPELVKKYAISKMLLAVHNTSVARRQELINELEPFAVELLTVPDVNEVASGARKINELREVKIEELLGREPVPPIEALLSANITGKNVMVTGAGGSIGSELCRQIVKSAPASVVLFELSEFNLYQIENELSTAYPHIPFYAVLASIQDTEALRAVMLSKSIQTIYHAAAYKHVPMVEANIFAGLRNNIFGTSNVALVATEFEVEKFVLVSTDKAVRPTNVMGATKRFAELLVQGIAELGSATEFAIVRFGNVLGSSGSVVPLFSEQIKKGGPITVTHPDITRFFMTIPEAAQLVIQAGAMGHSGEVFVLDMGDSVKIVDLASKMAHLMGHSIRTESNPTGDIELQFSGLRPGEKLYEELLIGEAEHNTEHPRIMAADEIKLSFADILMLLDKLNFALINRDEQKAKQILIEDAPLAYQPAKHSM
jgi:FlaA1/EpsC-like NDP-sugar epimerase